MEPASDLSAIPVQHAVRHVALGFVDRARQAADRLAPGDDPEALHDFRVACRRLRSWLRAFRDELRPPMKLRIRRALRDLLRATSASRDAEVRLAWLDAELSRTRGTARTPLRALAQRVRAERDDALDAARSVVNEKFPALAEALEERLERYERVASAREPRPLPETPIGSVAAALVREHAMRLEAALEKVRSVGDHEEAHRARIAGKRLRYLLEPLVAPGSDDGKVVSRLASLQDALGELHDAHVLAGWLSQATSEQPMAEGSSAAGGVATATAARRSARPRIPATPPGLPLLARRLALREKRAYASVRAKWLDGEARAFWGDIDALASELAHAAGVEYERKYLLDALPDAARHAPHADIDQGYVPGKRLVERLRRVREGRRLRFERTVKSGRGLSRLEIVEPTTAAVFATLWPLTRTLRVRKRRYRVVDGVFTWEVDVFRDQALVLAEVELPSPDTDVTVPSWLAPHVVREVTGEDAYVNVNLARPEPPRRIARRARAARRR